MEDTNYVPVEVAAERVGPMPEQSTPVQSPPEPAAAASTSGAPAALASPSSSTPTARPASSNGSTGAASPRTLEVPKPATRRPITDESHAATKIQASFRGHQARHKVATIKNPHLWPAIGPLSPQVNPPKRALRNPVFATLTTGSDKNCACPSPSNHGTIHLDSSFPPGLEGVYTHEQWTDVVHRVNTCLRTNYLPCCPAALLFLIPILGACAWFSWDTKLRERREQGIEQIFAAESEKLSKFGLQWLAVPLWTGNRPGRGNISGFVFELVMTHVAMQSARSRTAQIERIQSSPGPHTPAPKRETMPNATAAASNTAPPPAAAGNGAKLVQVQAQQQ